MYRVPTYVTPHRGTPRAVMAGGECHETSMEIWRRQLHDNMLHKLLNATVEDLMISNDTATIDSDVEDKAEKQAPTSKQKIKLPAKFHDPALC